MQDNDTEEKFKQILHGLQASLNTSYLYQKVLPVFITRKQLLKDHTIFYATALLDKMISIQI